jgi:HEAT repeat protein
MQNLINALRSENRNVREEAVKALQKIGTPSAVPGLIEALKDEDLCDRAAKALMHIGPRTKVAVPALTEMLDDEDQLVRNQAAWPLEIMYTINTPEAQKALEE